MAESRIAFSIVPVDDDDPRLLAFPAGYGFAGDVFIVCETLWPSVRAGLLAQAAVDRARGVEPSVMLRKG